jgi:hypothetical protein
MKIKLLVFSSPNSTLLVKKKSLQIKNILSVNRETSTDKFYSKRGEAYQKQQILKKLLKEYGLQQYLRVYKNFI